MEDDASAPMAANTPIASMSAHRRLADPLRTTLLNLGDEATDDECHRPPSVANGGPRHDVCPAAR